MTTEEMFTAIRKFSISESSVPETETQMYRTFHFKNGYSASIVIDKEPIGIKGYGRYRMIPLNSKGTVDFDVKLDVHFTSAEKVLEACKKVSKLRRPKKTFVFARV